MEINENEDVIFYHLNVCNLNTEFCLQTSCEVTQSCLTLCDPMDCSLPGSSVHGIFQARVLEWVDIPFSRRSSWPRDWTCVSHIAGRRFTVWATREAPILLRRTINKKVQTSSFKINKSWRCMILVNIIMLNISKFLRK